MKALRDDDGVSNQNNDDGPAMTAAERIRMEAAHGGGEEQPKADIRSLLNDDHVGES